MRLIAVGDTKYIKSLVLFFVIFGVTYLSLRLSGASSNTVDLVMGLTALLGLLLVLCSGRWDNLLMELQKAKWACLPLFIPIGLGFHVACRWLQAAASERGVLIVPGTGQINIANTVGIGPDAALVGIAAVILAPVTEEILFRFIGLGFIYRALSSNWNKNQVTLIMITWMIVLSLVFALLHRPGWPSLPVYFASGVLYGSIYLKYGLAASIIVHSSGNAGVYLLKGLFW